MCVRACICMHMCVCICVCVCVCVCVCIQVPGRDPRDRRGTDLRPRAALPPGPHSLSLSHTHTRARGGSPTHFLVGHEETHDAITHTHTHKHARARVYTQARARAHTHTLIVVCACVRRTSSSTPASCRCARHPRLARRAPSLRAGASHRRREQRGAPLPAAPLGPAAVTAVPSLGPSSAVSAGVRRRDLAADIHVKASLRRAARVRRDPSP